MTNLINFDEVESNVSVSAEGLYEFKVMSVEFGESTNKKTPYHKFTLITPNEESMTLTLYITPNSLWKYKIFAKAVTGQKLTGEIDIEKMSKSFVGGSFIGKVERCKPIKEMDVMTGEMKTVESKYFEITNFQELVSAPF